MNQPEPSVESRPKPKAAMRAIRSRARPRPPRSLYLFSLLLVLTSSHATTPADSSHYSQSLATLDAAGGQARSAHYSQIGSLGGVGGGIAKGGDDTVAKNGFAGQLYEVTSLKLAAAPTTLDEGGTSEVLTTATLDDATRLRLSAIEVRWRVFLGPVESIGTNGVVQFGKVYQDSVASIEAGYQDKFDGTRFRIRNVGLDDFGIYAHDQVPDLWQVQHFGINDPLGTAAADPDGDGQNNLFEYIAGLSPTNAASHLTLEIADLPDLPNQKALILTPRLDGRTYVLEVSTNLAVGFGPLTGAEQVDFGTTRFVLDPNATAPNKFYRVKITLP